MKFFVALALLNLCSSSSVVRRQDQKCEDKIRHCAKMSDEYDGCNEFSQLYKYTSINCRESCGLCVLDEEEVCEDKLGKEVCQNFIDFNNACDPESTHYKYATVGCKKSCGECALHAEESECKDLLGTDLCARVINQLGGCAGSQEKYIVANCEMSCGRCKAYDEDPSYCVDTLVTDTNRDAESNCKAFSKYCTSGVSWLKDTVRGNCKKTCDLC